MIAIYLISHIHRYLLLDCQEEVCKPYSSNLFNKKFPDLHCKESMYWPYVFYFGPNEEQHVDNYWQKNCNINKNVVLKRHKYLLESWYQLTLKSASAKMNLKSKVLGWTKNPPPKSVICEVRQVVTS